MKISKLLFIPIFFLLPLFIKIFTSCNEEIKFEKYVESLDELPSEIALKLKQMPNSDIWYTPVEIKSDAKTQKIKNADPHCICWDKGFSYILYPVTICRPVTNAQDKNPIKYNAIDNLTNTAVKMQEYKYSKSNSSGLKYCFETSGPWAAVIEKETDACLDLITFKCEFQYGFFSWYNSIKNNPLGQSLEGVRLSPKGCSSCGGGGTCNNNGGQDNPYDPTDAPHRQ